MPTAVGGWYGQSGDLRWVQRRARMVSLLAEADRLAALAELVGVTALAGHERMTMLGGRLLREGVLQQSALSPTDAYCSPAKTAALVDLVFDVVAQARELVDGGLPAAAVEEADYAPFIRARERPDAEQPAVIAAVTDRCARYCEAMP